MREASRQKLSDRALGDKVHRATLRTIEKRAHVVAEMPDWDALRSRARSMRLDALDRHEELLAELRSKLESRGVHVTVAETAEAAADLVTRLVLEAGGRVTKSKSMTSEEVHLNEALEHAGARVTETDLGELIVQLARQAPSHVTAPAIHLSVEDIARIFESKLDVPAPAWVREGASVDEPTRHALARELSLAARRALRRRFLEADVGISGANLLVAESATIVLVENEGNIQLTTCLPKRHVVLAGIDKLVARDEDAALLLRLLPVSATAQRQTCYVSLFADGHPDMHVVLLDHGRGALMRDREMRDLLPCIRCGACMNACPVYRNVGGHAYGGAYPGPIGAALMPFLEGFDRYAELPFASSLCGACTEACPVAIPLHERLLGLRARLAAGGLAPALGTALRAATSLMRSEARMQLAAAAWPLARPLASIAPLAAAWAGERELPPAPKQSFRAWHEQHRVDGDAPASSRRSNPAAFGRHPDSERHGSGPPGSGPPSSGPDAGPEPAAGETPLGTEPPRCLRDRFAERLRELGPGGETELRELATAREALAFVRSLLDGLDPCSVLVAGEPSEKRDYALGVTPAALLVADTAGVVLDLRERANGRASTLVETHVVVAEPGCLVAGLADLFEVRKRERRRGAWGDYQVVVTGPSRTADVEKVLVIPAHGPRRLVVVLCEEPVDLSGLRA
jgi:L-lactate dehydrogenase complex protein LldF